MSADRPVSGRARYPISCTGSRPGRLGNSNREPANAGPSPINVARITRSSTRRIVALFDRPGRGNLNIPQPAGLGLRLLGRTLRSDLGPANGPESAHLARAVRPGEGLLTETDSSHSTWRRLLLFLPHIGHSQRADPAIRSKESGHSAIGRWPAHSMTSSARVSNACGDLTPRARAVFELIRTQTWSAPVPADRLGARPGRSGTHPPSGAWATYVEISPRAAR